MENNVYEGKFLRVTEEAINGEIYERVYLKNSVTIFPFDSQGRILFIKEFRPHETPQVRWKPITGFYEEEQGFEENVNRELQEEVGKKAGRIHSYLKISQNGTLNVVQHFALAMELTESKLPNPDGEDSILDVKAVTLDQVLIQTLEGHLSRGTAGYVLLKVCHEIRNGTLRI